MEELKFIIKTLTLEKQIQKERETYIKTLEKRKEELQQKQTN